VSYGVFEEKEQYHAPSDDVVSHGEGGKERSKEGREGYGRGGLGGGQRMGVLMREREREGGEAPGAAATTIEALPPARLPYLRSFLAFPALILEPSDHRSPGENDLIAVHVACLISAALLLGAFSLLGCGTVETASEVRPGNLGCLRGCFPSALSTRRSQHLALA